VQLEDNPELAKAIQASQQGETQITLAALIRWYIDTFESISKWQRSKQTHLEFLERHPFSNNVALRLNVSQLVSHLKARRAAGVGLRRFVRAALLISVGAKFGSNCCHLAILQNHQNSPQMQHRLRLLSVSEVSWTTPEVS
jgi:hypothetical protein